MQNKQLLKQWLVSYIILLIIPVLFSVVVYIQAFNSLRDSVVQYNNKVIEEATDTIQKELLQLQKLHNNIALDNIFSNLIDEDEVDNDVIYQLNLAKNQLKIMNDSNYTNVYIYMEKIDYTVSVQTMDRLQGFYNSWFKGIYTYEEFVERLHSLGEKDISVMKNNEGDVVLLQNIVYNSIPVENAYTYFFIKRELFDKMVRDENREGYNNILVLQSEDNNMVYCSEPECVDIENSKRHIKYSRKCGNLLLSYYADKKMYSAPVNSIIFTIVINIICIIVAGAILIFILLRNNYKPVKKLIDKFKINPRVGENEYALIEHTFDKIMKEQQKLRNELNNHSTIVRSSLLNSLLFGKKIDEKVMNSLEYHNIVDNSHQCAVVICSIHDFGILSEDEYWDNYDDSSIIRTGNLALFNMLYELWSQSGLDVMSTEVDDFLVCLILDKDCHDKALNLITEGIVKVSQYMVEYFSISFASGVSGIKMGTGAISEAYKEAVASLEYCDFIRKKQTVNYDDLQMETSKYKYTFTFDHKSEFESLVRAGNAILAQEKVNQYLDEYTKDTLLSVNMVKLFIYDLMLSLLKMYIEVSDEEASEVFVLFEQLIHSSKITDMVAELNSTIQIVCAMYDDKRPNGVMNKIRDYIETNYDNYELNINKIGENFNFSPSYVSKMFRLYFDEDISAYIMKLRITKAKELLLTTNETVEKIAQMVGIGNKVTFTRSFKKVTDMTPGKYRKEHEG